MNGFRLASDEKLTLASAIDFANSMKSMALKHDLTPTELMLGYICQYIKYNEDSTWEVVQSVEDIKKQI